MAQEFWLSVLGSALGATIVLVLRSYLVEKGKNLATKQDIGAIEEKIQEARSGYNERLEQVRHELSLQMSRSGFRYQQEFEILKNLVEHLVDVRDKAYRLMPTYISLPDGSRNLEKTQEKAKELSTSLQELYRAQRDFQPFYPEEIFDAINEVIKHAHIQGIRAPNIPSDMDKQFEHLEQCERNRGEIRKTASAALEAIRRRVVDWE